MWWAFSIIFTKKYTKCISPHCVVHRPSYLYCLTFFRWYLLHDVFLHFKNEDKLRGKYFHTFKKYLPGRLYSYCSVRRPSWCSRWSMLRWYLLRHRHMYSVDFFGYVRSHLLPMFWILCVHYKNNKKWIWGLFCLWIFCYIHSIMCMSLL